MSQFCVNVKLLSLITRNCVGVNPLLKNWRNQMITFVAFVAKDVFVRSRKKFRGTIWHWRIFHSVLFLSKDTEYCSGFFIFFRRTTDTSCLSNFNRVYSFAFYSSYGRADRTKCSKATGGDWNPGMDFIFYIL